MPTIQCPTVRSSTADPANGPLAAFRSAVRERLPGPYALARRLYLRIRYAGRAVLCPVCGGHFRDWIVPEGRPWHQICPACESLPRQRLIWLWLRQDPSAFTRPTRLLHVAPELGLQRNLRRLPNISYVSTDIASPLAAVRADLTATPWPDETFDVVLCNHVLEHIPDDRKAMAELHRLLRPGGWGLALVPFQPDRTTHEDATITAAADRLRAFGQEDHVRLYGADYLERLRDAGFDVEFGVYARAIGDDAVRYHGLQPDEFLIVIRKPALDRLSAAREVRPLPAR